VMIQDGEMRKMNCRFCNAKLDRIFVSLGLSPLSNSYLSKQQLNKREPFFHLDLYVCDSCFLVQLEEFETPEHIFSEYAYFSSYSDTWLKHVKAYVEKMVSTFKIGRDSFVVEIASNDGYLLQYFMQKHVSVLGIEPAKNVAKTALKKGVPTEISFFGVETARRLVSEGRVPDLLLGNNVLAHVPDLNDFVEGLKILLKPGGVITMEFPHLMRLVEDMLFDTIYHEHFSYFSFLTVEHVFAFHGLTIFDVEMIPTHGGSLRIYARHREDLSRPISNNVLHLRAQEMAGGYNTRAPYLDFGDRVLKKKAEILDFLINAKRAKRMVVGYGAPAKGNTLLNYCGIKPEFIPYTVDRNPYKQGKYLPGSRIPIESPQKIRMTKPDYVFILPWNIKDEIMEQMGFIREWGGKFVIPVPKFEVV
jgi:2-polyprenyl-3-methyl-5-hydroxy-6-metoxy-1,4-benzoquinol methylase